MFGCLVESPAFAYNYLHNRICKPNAAMKEKWLRHAARDWGLERVVQAPTVQRNLGAPEQHRLETDKEGVRNVRQVGWNRGSKLASRPYADRRRGCEVF